MILILLITQFFRFMAPVEEAGVMVCCHGMGGDYKVAETIRQNGAKEHLISFDFPQEAYGTIDELIPLFSVLRECVVERGLNAVSLYGFSAGGGAVVNAIAVLNRTDYDKELLRVGIGEGEKKKLLGAIQNGRVILECPLKSVEEIQDKFGSLSFEDFARRYRENRLRPIDSIGDLKGLSLDVILFFQNPDEILGNRDDQMYANRLRQANEGNTRVIIANEGTHNSHHPSLWKNY